MSSLSILLPKRLVKVAIWQSECQRGRSFVVGVTLFLYAHHAEMGLFGLDVQG